MPSASILEERYQDQNPLSFKSHPKGRHLYWANLRWRSEHKGWGQLRPVKKTDQDFEEVKSHLAEAPLDLDIHGDNLIRRGDMVLCVKSEEEVEKRRLRNYNRATRLSRDLAAGKNLVAEELRSIRAESDEFQALKPTFSSEKGKQK